MKKLTLLMLSVALSGCTMFADYRVYEIDQGNRKMEKGIDQQKIGAEMIKDGKRNYIRGKEQRDRAISELD